MISIVTIFVKYFISVDFPLYTISAGIFSIGVFQRLLWFHEIKNEFNTFLKGVSNKLDHDIGINLPQNHILSLGHLNMPQDRSNINFQVGINRVHLVPSRIRIMHWLHHHFTILYHSIFYYLCKA